MAIKEFIDGLTSKKNELDEEMKAKLEEVSIMVLNEDGKLVPTEIGFIGLDKVSGKPVVVLGDVEKLMV